MANTKVTFTKITSTPTAMAWSQTYSAGNFAALIALSQKENQEEDLQTIGREIVTTLEAEYFTLENKNLNTIKTAVEQAVSAIPEAITANIIVATVVNDILYTCLYGGGKVFIKRDATAGLLLEKPALAIAPEKKQVISASGHTKINDIYLLVSDTLLIIVPQEKLLDQIVPDKLEEVTENISLQLHKKKEGSASAILFTINGDITNPSMLLETPETTSETSDETSQASIVNQVKEENNSILLQGRSAFKNILARINRRLLFGGIALLIIVIIVINISLSIQKKQQQAEHTSFERVYTEAQAKYDEGESLLSLNKQAAKDDLVAAKSAIIPYQTKFLQSSPEHQQIASLLQKINDGLTVAKAENQSTSKQATEKDSPVLTAENKQNALYATQDDKSIYLADTNGVTAIDKRNNKSDTIIKNKNDWSDLGGFGTYLGNVYILDRKGTLIKYIVTSNGFGKGDYFSGTKIDLSKVQGMAIDGSVYILFDDGLVKKFTKGKPDTFALSGLDKPFNHPIRIFTTKDATNLYILDNGNRRIVILNKDGVYQSQYTADILGSAKDIDVVEKDKKIFVLSQGKIWEIDIK